MPLRRKCPSCKNDRFFIRKRRYFSHILGKHIVTNEDICSQCAEDLSDIIKNINKSNEETKSQ